MVRTSISVRLLEEGGYRGLESRPTSGRSSIKGRAKKDVLVPLQVDDATQLALVLGNFVGTNGSNDGWSVLLRKVHGAILLALADYDEKNL